MFRGKPKSTQWRQQVSNRMKQAYREGQLNMQGQNNPMFGRKRPDVSKWHEDPAFTRKRFQGMRLKPNKKERKLDELLKEHNFGFRYVGDGVALIGRCCPDFMHEERNKVIELFGDCWHLPQEVERRINYFDSKGFSALIIWEHELGSESQIVEKVEAFMKQPQEYAAPQRPSENAVQQLGHFRNSADGRAPGGIRS